MRRAIQGCATADGIVLWRGHAYLVNVKRTRDRL